MAFRFDEKVRSVHLEVTGRCNLECVYCYNSDLNNENSYEEELSIDEIKRLVNEAKELGCRNFRFSGGEPFLKEGMFEVVDELRGCNVAFLTNGKILCREFIDKLMSYPQINEIKISWDGFAAHNELRKGSDWRHIAEVIPILKEKKYYTVINTDVLALNLPEIPKLYHWLKRLKIDRWRVDIPFILGRFKRNHNLFKIPRSEDFIDTFAEIIRDYLTDKPSFEMEVYHLFKSEFKPNNTLSFNTCSHPCEYRGGSVPMRPNGDILLCPSLDLPFSNFKRSGGLKKALAEKKLHPFFKLKMSDLKECADCRYLRVCGGGCRVNAIASQGDNQAADPQACSLFPQWEEKILPIYEQATQSYLKKTLIKEGKIPKKYF